MKPLEKLDDPLRVMYYDPNDQREVMALIKPSPEGERLYIVKMAKIEDYTGGIGGTKEMMEFLLANTLYDVQKTEPPVSNYWRFNALIINGTPLRVDSKRATIDGLVTGPIDIELFGPDKKIILERAEKFAGQHPTYKDRPFNEKLLAEMVLREDFSLGLTEAYRGKIAGRVLHIFSAEGEDMAKITLPWGVGKVPRDDPRRKDIHRIKNYFIEQGLENLRMVVPALEIVVPIPGSPHSPYQGEALGKPIRINKIPPFSPN
ncbi:hypothetical protein HYU13_02445 [Candidatus Woesearchaeota archaeon]|nr:hypothetical protein [Candidatus Woesearchaeota archaeon]